MASNGPPPPGFVWEAQQRAKWLLRIVDPEGGVREDVDAEESLLLLAREQTKLERRERLAGLLGLALIALLALLAASLYEAYFKAQSF